MQSHGLNYYVGLIGMGAPRAELVRDVPIIPAGAFVGLMVAVSLGLLMRKSA
jgi:hypothetical protein